MAEKIGVLYYSNIDGNKSRITRDFVSGLAEQFKIQFEKALDVFSSNIGRNFTERQAYGLFTIALDKIKEAKLKFVITEFPLNRTRSVEGSNSGRLDYLVNYNDVILAIELKIAHAGLGADKAGGSRLRNAWVGSDGVVDQLLSISIKNDSHPFNDHLFAKKTIVKLPVLIVCYYSLSNVGSGVPTIDNEKMTSTHQSVYKSLAEPDDNFRPLFDILYAVEDNKRETMDNRNIIIHGLGLFAGAKEFEE